MIEYINLFQWPLEICCFLIVFLDYLFINAVLISLHYATYVSIITAVLRSTNTFNYVATFFYFAITKNFYQNCSYMFPVHFLLLKVYTSPCIITIL